MICLFFCCTLILLSSTQEVTEKGELKIIHKVRGGPWGGEYTNKYFLKVIATIIGTYNLVKKISTYKCVLSIKRDKLILKAELFAKLFSVQITNIVSELKDILQNERCSNVSAIIIAGGHLEAEVVQTSIKNEFCGSDMEIFIPINGVLSVLKGAVIYGHNPKIVPSRICNFTQVVALNVPFDSVIHPIKTFLTANISVLMYLIYVRE